tara:strand:+ start:1240 stop:1344 length:105 start_codon:yes stop_codon:yes gene_type:complete
MHNIRILDIPIEFGDLIELFFGLNPYTFGKTIAK